MGQPPEAETNHEVVAFGDASNDRRLTMEHCGIDLASKTSAVCVMKPDGRIVREGMVPTDEDGFRTCLGRCESMQVVIEASPLAEWTARVVESLGHEVVVIDPRRAKAVICTKKKTDRLDARNLARMSCTGWYTQVHRKSAEARLSRSELKARQGLVETANAMGARIRGLLRAHGIRVGKVSEGEFEARVWDRVCAEAPELQALLRPLFKIWRDATKAADRMYRSLRMRSRRDPLRALLMSAPGGGPSGGDGVCGHRR
jgi:transposase